MKINEVVDPCRYDISSSIWTLGDPIKSSLYLGHDKSVRAATFAPDNSSKILTLSYHHYQLLSLSVSYYPEQRSLRIIPVKF